jgi:hypothetical protein
MGFFWIILSLSQEDFESTSQASWSKHLFNNLASIYCRSAVEVIILNVSPIIVARHFLQGELTSD